MPESTAYGFHSESKQWQRAIDLMDIFETEGQKVRQML